MEKFNFLGNEEQIVMYNGSHKEDDKKQTVKVYFSNKRIVFLKPIPMKNLIAGLILFFVTMLICGAIFTVGIISNSGDMPTWVMPVCLIIAGGVSARWRNMLKNPRRYPQLLEIKNIDIKKVECKTSLMHYPVFTVYTDDDQTVVFSCNDTFKKQLKNYFKARFSETK